MVGLLVMSIGSDYFVGFLWGEVFREFMRGCGCLFVVLLVVLEKIKYWFMSMNGW